MRWLLAAILKFAVGRCKSKAWYRAGTVQSSVKSRKIDCLQSAMKEIRAAPKGAWRDFFRACSLCSLAVLSISSRFLCPRPPLLLCAPNQNRHATQAWGLATCRPIGLQPKPRAAKTIESKNRSVEKNLWHPVFTMAWLVLCDKIWDNLAYNGFIQGCM